MVTKVHKSNQLDLLRRNSLEGRSTLFLSFPSHFEEQGSLQLQQIAVCKKTAVSLTEQTHRSMVDIDNYSGGWESKDKNFVLQALQQLEPFCKYPAFQIDRFTFTLGEETE